MNARAMEDSSAKTRRTLSGTCVSDQSRTFLLPPK